MHLNAHDVQTLVAAQRVLSAPLEYPTRRAWARAACRHVRTVVDAPGGVYMHTVDGNAAFCGDGAPAPVVAAFRDNYRAVADGPPVFEDDLLTASTAVRWRSGCDVYHERDLAPREQVVRSPFYQSVLRPNAFHHVAGLSLSLPEGEVSLVLNFERGDVAGLSEAGMSRLRLLTSSFEAGVRAQLQLGRRRAAIGRLLDAFGTPLLLVSLDGRILHRSRACDEASGGDALTTAMLQVARRTVWSTALPASSIQVGAERVPYRLWTATAPEELAGQPAVLVGADRQGVQLPSVPSLQERHGLTPREAEVALLMARGLTTPQVAQRLGVSVHTARTHCERVVAKLNVPSRAGVALALMNGQ